MSCKPAVASLQTLMDEELARKLALQDTSTKPAPHDADAAAAAAMTAVALSDKKGKRAAVATAEFDDARGKPTPSSKTTAAAGSASSQHGGKTLRSAVSDEDYDDCSEGDEFDDFTDDYDDDDNDDEDEHGQDKPAAAADETDPDLLLALELSRIAQEDGNQREDSPDNDLVIAAMLQRQFDLEYNEEVARSERKMNIPGSKVAMSLHHHRVNVLSDDNDSADDDDSDNDDDVLHDPTVVRDGPIQGQLISGAAEGHGNLPRGRRRGGLNSITKHDASACNLRNARKIERFPPNFQSGHIGNDGDIRISSVAFNKLREHSKKEENNRQRQHGRQDHSTHALVMDSRTRMIIYKMVNNGSLLEVNGVISTGKEAAVYHAFGNPEPDEDAPDAVAMPAEVAIKIFKTTLNEFRNRKDYMEDDFRFQDKHSKQNPRKVIKLWAEKETHNLAKLAAAGINCPEVVVLRQHLLVMTFLGEDGVPAPKLKEARLESAALEACYDQVVDMMTRMYNVCHLVHADLSEYNILFWQDEPYFIDLSQAVDTMHPQALLFLLRDCENVTRFFAQRGAANCMSAGELFSAVSGIDVPSEDSVRYVHDVQEERNAFQAARAVC
ncbi:Atypical/RIO protein kinase [Capsaspora owczarzaki ATCC 30864]|uniref:Serine/threonine-protein kinase RIO3 n=2 Tax=Capsaspora owczarzaki (strain ATCC 30864) TaxID=595528 RepID=A0A0D2WWF4_CAPO3|nr:Atypical/RIO protein kinase [Capsaspora owczarzaki ATCC 30864]